MKFNEAIEDEVKNFYQSNPEEFAQFRNRLTKTMPKLDNDRYIKIELYGVDNDKRGSEYGDKLAIYEVEKDGVKIPGVAGKTIRFGFAQNTKDDAKKLANLIEPGDVLFANRLSAFLLSIDRTNTKKNYSPKFPKYDIVYNMRTGDFKTKADL